jgi:hypothetical protein
MSEFKFSFNIFLSTYSELNVDSPRDFDDELKKNILETYKKYNKDYVVFIEEVANLLNMSEKHKNIYLKQNVKCTMCDKNYKYDKEPFIIIRKYENNEDITKEMCKECIYNCRCGCMCNYKNDPYDDTIYIDDKNDESIYYCEKCVSDE